VPRDDVGDAANGVQTALVGEQTGERKARWSTGMAVFGARLCLGGASEHWHWGTRLNTPRTTPVGASGWSTDRPTVSCTYATNSTCTWAHRMVFTCRTTT